MILLCSGLCLHGQQDTTPPAAKPKGFRNQFNAKWEMEHSPLKATIYAAVLPGSGQAYNKKYWKIPIVYAGLGTCTGFIIYNNRKYHHFLDAYRAETDEDPSTVNETEYNASQLFDIQDTYHSWRDLSYICLVGVYLLQILDADIDAHLWYFDISDDLSLTWRPSLIPANRVQTGLSVTLGF